MKTSDFGTQRVLIVTAALTFGAALIAVDTVWPAAFTAVVAIGGVAGALTVLYEVQLTKRLAHATFIRDLQTGFAVDQNISELWRKLLLKEDITAADRHLISSYLTFFETLHLLLNKGALQLSLTDDLFRNRFFTAIGNDGVQRNALIAEAGAFTNIHGLIERWHDHLLKHGIPVHSGYYSYVRALVEANGYAVKRLAERDPPYVTIDVRLFFDLLRGRKKEIYAHAQP